MLLRLRVTYARVADFLADVRTQVARGGLLVRVDPGAADRGAPVELEIVTPAGRAGVAARVLQVLAGAGVAVELDPAALAQLVAAAERRGGDGAAAGPAPVHERVTDAEAEAAPAEPEPVPAPPPAAAPAPGAAQLQAQKIQQALHGDKHQRMAILREPNKMLHGYVLRNPQLQLDEVVFIARMTTVSTDLLTFIAGKREWAERPEVALALVRNPKTPVPLALRMLEHVGASELRNLAKSQGVREAIQRAARKKVVG